MSSVTVTAVVLGCLFAGAALGLWLGGRLPDHHRNPESHDAVKLTTGMLSVLAALVLGLLLAGVKNSFDTTDTQVRQFAATLLLLDETLRDFGPETAPARDMLRRYTARALDDNWPTDKHSPIRMEDVEAGRLLDNVHTAVLALPGGDYRSNMLRTEAAALAETALNTRWLLIERVGSSIQPLFMAILIVWITLIFVSFGYNAPHNATVATAFVLGGAALAGCIFLIVEMDGPFEGLITVSDLPMRNALAHMNP